ncbi:MAG: repeat containing protein [Gammaproteobacteria bacterium]|jgi:tetratricopeptide (TPR) repeat protein|nr:repeat containing protein [Gammaproteobacteria bacterium]
MPDEKAAVAARKLKDQGNAYFQSGKYDQALNCYNKGIMLDPSMPELWYYKGMAHKKVNEAFLAVKAFDEALALRSGYEEALSEKASLTFQKQVIFFVADLTLNEEGRIKILEFGRGFQSGLSGHDSLLDSEFDHIQNKLKRILREKYLEAPVLFNSGFGNYIPDETKLNRWLAAVEKKAKPDAAIKGIYGGFTTRKVPENILILDHDPRLGLLGQDKEFSHRQFSADIIQFRPLTSIVAAPYHSASIDGVHPAIRAGRCVVKCPDGANGLSVDILPAENLDKRLKQLLGNKGEKDIKEAAKDAMTEATRGGFNMATLMHVMQKQASMNSSSSVVLVEQFSPSKVIQVKDEPYRPTMRAVFLVEMEGNSSEFTPIAAYWKLPCKPEGKGTLEESYISKVDPRRVSSALVSKEDEALVFAQLKACVPTVMKNALSFDIHRYALELIEAKGEASLAKRKRKHGIYLLSHYANNLGGIGMTERALEVLEIIGTYGKDSTYYRERGVAYQAAGDYDNALKELEIACRLEPDELSVARRIAMVQSLKAGDMEGARKARAQTVFSPADIGEIGRIFTTASQGSTGAARGGAGGGSASYP